MRKNKYKDTLILAKRCMLLSKRNPDTLITSIVLPLLMMGLFVSLFGKLVNVENISYVNYIVPGVLLQCFAQSSSTTAVAFNQDITSGIMKRFSTLPISKKAILNGPVLEAIIRHLLTAMVVLIFAYCFGFRPMMNLSHVLLLFILLIMVILVFSWLALMIGIISKSAQGASGLFTLVIVLPYLSSGFVPIEEMNEILGFFAKYQPLTPMIDTLRSCLLGKPLDYQTVLIAFLWCTFLLILFYFIVIFLFKKKLEE